MVGGRDIAKPTREVNREADKSSELRWNHPSAFSGEMLLAAEYRNQLKVMVWSRGMRHCITPCRARAAMFLEAGVGSSTTPPTS